MFGIWVFHFPRLYEFVSHGCSRIIIWLTWIFNICVDKKKRLISFILSYKNGILYYCEVDLSFYEVYRMFVNSTIEKGRLRTSDCLIRLLATTFLVMFFFVCFHFFFCVKSLATTFVLFLFGFRHYTISPVLHLLHSKPRYKSVECLKFDTWYRFVLFDVSQLDHRKKEIRVFSLSLNL